MDLKLDTLKKDEQVSLSLRALFEQYGYKKYRAGRFEEYSLYLENKNFLLSDNLITFNAPEGKLLALKPDVTLSIVKNTKGTKLLSERLYYVENVYRYLKQSGEFKEISQTGLELIGRAGDLETAEVIELALKSLETIDSNYVLDISHMGFLSGILGGVSLENGLARLIKEKNLHELYKTAAQNGLSDKALERLSALISLSGAFKDVLKKAEKLVLSKETENALKELNKLYENIGVANQNLKLDFSIVNDNAYYNGIIFQGYVEKVPFPVLSGGRYDRLLEKFGKDAEAIGFAVYLDNLSGYYQSPAFEVDILALYDDNTEKDAFTAEIGKLRSEGRSVRAERQPPQDIKYKKLIDRRGKNA